MCNIVTYCLCAINLDPKKNTNQRLLGRSQKYLALFNPAADCAPRSTSFSPRTRKHEFGLPGLNPPQIQRIPPASARVPLAIGPITSSSRIHRRLGALRLAAPTVLRTQLLTTRSKNEVRWNLQN